MGPGRPLEALENSDAASSQAPGPRRKGARRVTPTAGPHPLNVAHVCSAGIACCPASHSMHPIMEHTSSWMCRAAFSCCRAAMQLLEVSSCPCRAPSHPMRNACKAMQSGQGLAQPHHNPGEAQQQQSPHHQPHPHTTPPSHSGGLLPPRRPGRTPQPSPSPPSDTSGGPRV